MKIKQLFLIGILPLAGATLPITNSFASSPLFADGFEASTISGTLKFGNTLTANANGGKVSSYQWYANGVIIPGATQQTYTLKKIHTGNIISVKITYEDGSEKTLTASTPVEGLTQHAGLLNDTGITFGDNYPTGNNKDCSGERIQAQDCSSGLDAKAVAQGKKNGFQFVKVANSGAELAKTASDWACVTDKRNGLTWEKKNTSGLHSNKDTFSWYIRNGFLNGGAVGAESADKNTCHGYQSGNDLTYCNTQAFIDRVNEEKLCGYDDWRLPFREEIRNIADLSKVAPIIDTDFFPNTDTGDKTFNRLFYWTGSVFAKNYNYAWTFDFYDAYGNFYSRSDSYHVRLVRGQPKAWRQ